MTQRVIVVATGKTGPSPQNIDGGYPDTEYGGTVDLDGGQP